MAGQAEGASSAIGRYGGCHAESLVIGKPGKFILAECQRE